MARVGRLLLLVLAVLPSLARATDSNGHHEAFFEQFRVVLNVTATGASSPKWYVSGTNVTAAGYADAAAKPAGANPVHDTIRLSATRLKIEGTLVVSTSAPPLPGTTGGTAGGTTGGPGGGPGDPGCATGGATLWCGPAAYDAHPEEPPQEPDPWAGIPIFTDLPGSRFASTHFHDGQSFGIVLETDWDLMKNGVATGS